MARWVKALAAKPEDLSSNPRTYMVEGTNFIGLSLTSTFKL